MKQNILLLVEGMEDAVFIQHCIKEWFPTISRSLEIYNPGTMKNSTDGQALKSDVIIFTTNSQDKLTLWFKPPGVARQILDVRPTMKILVIFDADRPDTTQDPQNKQNRGVAAKRSFIIQRASSVSVQLSEEQIFLLPDNATNGTLEDLLKSCIPDERTSLLHCWQSYADCLRSSGYTTPSDKTMLFAYAEVNTTYNDAFGNKRNYQDSNHWNIDHATKHLSPLYTFLEKHFSESQQETTP